jgi:hypothetical protein
MIAPIPARIAHTLDDLPLVRDSVGSLPDAKVISDLEFNNGFLSRMLVIANFKAGKLVNGM